MNGPTQKNTKDTANQLLRIVRELSEELRSRRISVPLDLDTSLDRDLGLDSLARVELLARIEQKFGVTLSEGTFVEMESVRDLLRAVLGAGRVPPSNLQVRTMSPAGAKGEDLPHTASTLIEVMDHHLQSSPDRTHIRVYDDDKDKDVITCGQLHDGARAVASGLQARGLLPGEPVAIMLATGRDYFFTFFGVLLAGGIPVPLYPPMQRSRIGDHLARQQLILANCGPKIMVTMPEITGFARLLKAQTAPLREVVTARELTALSGKYTRPVITGRDTALLQYTSGSTGNPKGVVLTHANLLSNIRAMGERVNAQQKDVFVSWLPLYHDMGLIGAWLSSLYFGATLVIMSPIAFITRPVRWLQAIHRYGGTLSAAPNFAYSLCVHKLEDKDLKGLDLKSWRCAFNGAEPVSPETITAFSRRFAGYGFRPEAMMPVYGLAESSVGLTFPPPGRGPVIDKVVRQTFMDSHVAMPGEEGEKSPLSFVSSGPPLSGHEIRIVDTGNRELPERREGRLQFRGPSTTSGYYHAPEQTRNLFCGTWLDSGDLAYMAGGEVYLTGRIKDIIIRGGRNIHPSELEEAVGNLPGVRKGNVAVFGSTEPGQVNERMIILAETREKDPAALDALRSRIDLLAVNLVETPADEVILAPPGTVLKTSSGKIRRSACRLLYEQGRLHKGTAPLWWQLIRLTAGGLGPQLRNTARTCSQWIYAAWTWSLFYSLGALVWMAVILLPLASWRWQVVRKAVSILAGGSLIPLSVRGRKHLPQKTPFILVANHASYVDSYVLIATLPRTMRFVAKSELAANPFIRLVLRRLGTEFVERFDKHKGIEDARRIGRTAGKTGVLIFFPEGTFSRIPGLRPFHMGAFAAAVEADLPVVPVAIRGTRSILRSGTWFPRRGPVTVTIGQPVHPAEIRARTGKNPWTTAIGIRNACRADILRHCGEPDLAEETTG